MISERLHEWEKNNNAFGCEVDRGIFSMFYQVENRDKDLPEILTDLAYAIYELEVCVDGLIEDMEYQDGQKNKKT